MQVRTGDSGDDGRGSDELSVVCAPCAASTRSTASSYSSSPVCSARVRAPTVATPLAALLFAASDCCALPFDPGG